MIYGIVGKPGGGKSYYSIYMTRYFLSRGVDVYSNIITYEEKFKLKSKKIGNLYYWDKLIQLRNISNGVVIFDESTMLLDSHEWKDFTVEDRIKFRQHRHHNLDIYLTAQAFTNVDKTIRDLVNFVIRIKNIDIFGLKIFWTKMYDPADVDLKTSKSIQNKIILFDPNIACAYKTKQYKLENKIKFQTMKERIEQLENERAC